MKGLCITQRNTEEAVCTFDGHPLHARRPVNTRCATVSQPMASHGSAHGYTNAEANNESCADAAGEGEGDVMSRRPTWAK